MYQRILLAYDGSESGQKALLGCQEIAQWSHAEMYLIAVMWINKGPTALDTKVQFTNWDDVERFAVDVGRLTASAGVAEQRADALAA